MSDDVSILIEKETVRNIDKIEPDFDIFRPTTEVRDLIESRIESETDSTMDEGKTREAIPVIDDKTEVTNI